MSSSLVVEVDGSGSQEVDACVKVAILESYKSETESQSGPEQRERLLRSISQKTSSYTHETELAELRSGSSITIKAPVSPLLAQMLGKVGEWQDFNILQVAEVAEGRPLTAVVNTVLSEEGLIDLFKIDQEKLDVFLRDLELSYQANAYHNSIHAADVVQAVYSVLKKDNLMAKLQPWEVLGLILAAAGHDVGHPGLTNKFLCETHAPIAVTHGYSSPNERSHAALTIQLLIEDKVLSHLPEHEVIRSLIADVILPTDMLRHHEVVAAFSKEVEASGADLTTWSAPAKRTKALAMLVHMADISNVARPRPLAIKWGLMVMQEAHEQGDRERALKMAVCALNDRSQPDLPGSQRGFVGFFKIREAFVALAGIAPAFVEMVLPLLDANLAFYADLEAKGVKMVPPS